MGQRVYGLLRKQRPPRFGRTGIAQLKRFKKIFQDFMLGAENSTIAVESFGS